jgi:hypothetical protein
VICFVLFVICFVLFVAIQTAETPNGSFPPLRTKRSAANNRLNTPFIAEMFIPYSVAARKPSQRITERTARTGAKKLMFA